MRLPGCSTSILLATIAYLATGVVAFCLWRLTGNVEWVRAFFRTPGALLLVALAAIELWTSVIVTREFTSTDPMRSTWQLISLAAAFGALGTLGVQVLSRDSLTNPLRLASWWSPDAAARIRDVAAFFGGTCRYVVLAIGLYYAVRIYRHAGLAARLKPVDWILIAAIAGYIVLTAVLVLQALHRGKVPSAWQVSRWPVDPLLCALLGEAIVLYRSAKEMGGGWISLCWRAFSIGIFLTVAGDVLNLADAYGYLPEPWAAVGWYIWIPAAGAFALAPAYQWEAMSRARGSREGSRRNPALPTE